MPAPASAAHRKPELPDTKWTGDLTREFHLDALMANHAILRTGRLTIE
ncbi:hypothetical protein OH805_23795 [Streptomyces sp. NBC_00879]|nr:hypothetical protein OH805_23795 [Streptomyces sp. NBC_00879]